MDDEQASALNENRKQQNADKDEKKTSRSNRSSKNSETRFGLSECDSDGDGDVTIVLSRNKWNESLKAIKNLIHFAQKEREKEKEKKEKKEENENRDILYSIDMLFKNVFSSQRQKEEIDISDKIENITSEQFDCILNQIENDNHENENKNNNKNERENGTLKKQFCKNFAGFGHGDFKMYEIESLSSIETNCGLIFDDFLSINTELIDGELKNLLLKHSSNKEDIDFLYDKIISRRNICSLFPFKHHSYDWHKYGSDYISLIDRLNANKNDKIKMFCILHNCMVNVVAIGDDDWRYGGLDRYIGEQVVKSDERDLNSLCEWYILVEMAKTGIFGKDTKLDNCYGKEVYSSSVVSCIISNIFDNDLSSFKKLLKCCVQDIKFKNDIKKLRDIYANNNNKQGDFDYGIQFYVLNRLTYYVYHDLLLNISMKNDNVLLFPKLKNFFAFLYNFAVYCHCHLHLGADKNDKAECLLDYMC